MNLEILEKTLKTKDGHIFMENIFEKLSDPELIQLRVDIEKSKNSSEIYNLIEAKISSQFWRIRYTNQNEKKCDNFEDYCDNVEQDRENQSLCWNSIDFN